MSMYLPVSDEMMAASKVAMTAQAADVAQAYFTDLVALNELLGEKPLAYYLPGMYELCVQLADLIAWKLPDIEGEPVTRTLMLEDMYALHDAMANGTLDPEVEKYATVLAKAATHLLDYCDTSSDFVEQANELRDINVATARTVELLEAVDHLADKAARQRDTNRNAILSAIAVKFGDQSLAAWEELD